MLRRRSIALGTCLMALNLTQAAEFAWQEAHATVTESGSIVWTPRPFNDDLSNQEVRYIDFDGGNDSADGRSPDTAWKHHPWDPWAEGQAKTCEGPITYVFKRGVFYRNPLKADESGTPERPIRLTSTASWGEGEATLAGSKRLPPEWHRLQSTDAPKLKHLPDVDKVWVYDLGSQDWWNNGKVGYHAAAIGEANFERNRPRVSVPYLGLFRHEDDGSGTMLHLARDPDWQPAGNEYAHDYWHRFSGNKKPMLDENGEEAFTAISIYGAPAQDDYLKGKPQDFFDGAIFWSTYPSLMGGALPHDPMEPEVTHKKTKKTIPSYNPKTGQVALIQFHGFSKGTSYKIENVPGYLDSAGEFYLHTEGKGKNKKSLLYYRPADGVDPNQERLELVVNGGNIYLQDRSHIDIAGLGFRYSEKVAISANGQCEHISIRNCTFSDLINHAIVFDVKPDYGAWIKKKWNDPEAWKQEIPDQILIADNELTDIWDSSIQLQTGSSFGTQTWPWGHPRHIEVLRNRLYNVGLRHSSTRYSAIPAISVRQAETGIIAGNVIKKSFGSGIMVFGGQTEGMEGSDWPLTRLLIYHNSTEDTALAINDYGGFSLWQGGQLYVYNNNIGNSVGFMPGGIFGNGRETTLSYPYYIDGGYKIYGFNNVVWDRSNDYENDPYASKVAGYFSVFGFLNHFTNNTLYRHARATGGSSGNRTDIISNIFADISMEFLKNNRVENPSLVGGGDTGASGIMGIPSLAYGKNIFHGSAIGGSLVENNERKGVFVEQEIAAESLDKLAEQMQAFPTRWGQLGTKVEELPIVGELEENGLTEKGSQAADFRLTPDSPAIDAGAQYFYPWALGATVGEWNFTENHADPSQVVDYALYMGEAYYDRFMYSLLPILSLQINAATLEDYVPAPSEDWVNGALAFDGQRFCTVTDESMRADIAVRITQFITGRGQQSWKKYDEWVKRPMWSFPEPEGGMEGGNPNFGPDQVASYPGEKRNSLISTTRPLLLEAKFRTDAGHSGGVLMNKHDGDTGYALAIDDKGHAVFTISAGGGHSSVSTAQPVNNDEWQHVLAEIDRESGRMAIYLNGRLSEEGTAGIAAGTSIDTTADFVVGRASAKEDGYLKGAIDFMRVCHSTLAQSRTSIEELYAWQYTHGPALFDMRGKPITGERRDAGALERQ